MFLKKGNKRAEKAVIEKFRMHFVMNTLNVLRLMIRKNPDTAYDMVYDLAVFLRGNCDTIAGEGAISFAEEMKFVKAYLNLEEIQKSNFRVVYELPDWKAYVGSGQVYEELLAFLKKNVFQTAQKSTLHLRIQEETQELEYWIEETGKRGSISIKREEA